MQLTTLNLNRLPFTWVCVKSVKSTKYSNILILSLNILVLKSTAVNRFIFKIVFRFASQIKTSKTHYVFNAETMKRTMKTTKLSKKTLHKALVHEIVAKEMVTFALCIMIPTRQYWRLIFYLIPDQHHVIRQNLDQIGIKVLEWPGN